MQKDFEIFDTCLQLYCTNIIYIVFLTEFYFIFWVDLMVSFKGKYSLLVCGNFGTGYQGE